MNSKRHIRAAFRKEFSDWRVWLTRAMVVAFATLTGLGAVGWRRAAQRHRQRAQLSERLRADRAGHG